MQRLLLLTVFVCAASLAGAQPLVLVPTPLVIPQKFQKYYDSAETVYLPAGFTATVFYTGTFISPRFMALDSAGNVCVADGGSSSVIRLLDTNNDGVADTAITIAMGTGGAEDIAFHDGDLFTAASSHTDRYSIPDEHGVFTSKAVFIQGVGDAAQGTDDHTSRTILFDDRSNSLFMSVGSPCDACRETDTMRASIVRYNQDGSNPTLFASGLRNAVGLALDSSYHVWATVAERNNQGEDVPGDLLTGIEQNESYGWPLAYGNHVWDNFTIDSEYQAMLPITHEDSVHVSAMRVPDAVIPAHSTPLGIAFYHDTTLPATYDQSFFVAVHGSYDGPDGRLVANGSKVILLQHNNGTWATQDFCTGFLTDSIHYLRWARPCGIILDRKGNIYVSSDHSSTHSSPAIFRISYSAKNSVASNSLAAQLSISPNPTTAQISIFSSGTALLGVQVLNVLGETILNEPAPRESDMTLDFSKLPSGTYFVRIETAKGSVLRKVIRQ